MEFKELRVKDIPSLGYVKTSSEYLYLGPTLTDEERDLLSGYNYSYLHKFFGHEYWITSEKIKYTYPGINLPDPFTADVFCQAARDSIYASTGVSINPQSRCFVYYDDGAFVVFIGDATIEWAISFLEYKGQSYEARSKAAEEESKGSFQDNQVRFSATPIDYPRIQFSIGSAPKREVDKFDAEMIRAAEEVRRAIGDLLLNGFSASLIQSWITEQLKLSRLRVTRLFKIQLVDYDLEIKMGPLPKTIFLFYLCHPEGVRFSYLQDHVKELMHIYERVSVNDDPQKMTESIAALTDPLNNSINEKCAAIKKAFLLQVNDDVAKNYYVTGMQGGVKGITLDRNLVEWECEL